MRYLLVCTFFAFTTSMLLCGPYHQPTRKEIERAATTVRLDTRCPAQVQFISGGPADPLKNDVLTELDSVQPCIAFVLRDRKTRMVYEVFNNARTGEVIEWRRIDKAQPMLTFDDFDSASAIVRRHEGWQRGLTRRGLTPDDVVIDSWASGIPNENFPFRIVRALTYLKSGTNTNLYYDRPIEGLVCTVNLDAHLVMEFYDQASGPVPPSMGDFNLDYKEDPQTQAPFKIQQQAKKAVRISDGEISWMGWRFHVLLHARDGLVIHHASFDDHGKRRSILHRLGMSEMVVPYGDTSQHWYWRSAFDIGEYGVGNLTTPLRVGVDVPENAQTIDAVFANPDGTPREIKRAIAAYERDAGIIWKHADPFTGDNRARRGRELVVMSITTVGNYDYSLAYVFSMDGTITVDVGLTGILLAKGVPDTSYNENSRYGQMYGTLVAPNIITPNHQHFFAFRIDLDVDGPQNTVSELDMWSPPVAENRHGNAIAMDDYEWLFEGEAHGDISLQRARKWVVRSSTTRNALGGSPAYMLVPGPNATPYFESGHQLWKRAAFLKHHVWATRFKDAELYAAGMYPNQSLGGDGVEEYARDNESLRGKDVVLWYTMGISHHPRPEEWPIMNMQHIGFKIEPMGFFDKNPALFLKP